MSSSKSPCAACKCLRRKCTQECVSAPYFPPDQPQKFINVHRVFGSSNVAKLLNDINVSQREDAVNSLAYEAESRLRDPVYGCVGLISVLQHRLKQIQEDLYNAKKELATYIGPTALLPILQPSFMQQHPNNPSSSTLLPYNMQPVMGLPTGLAAPHGAQLIIRDPQQHQHQHQHQQMIEAQQLAAAAAAAREQQEMLRSYQQHQQPQQPPPQPDQMRFNTGFDTAGAATATAFNQMPAAAGLPPSLALGSYESVAYHQMQQPPSEHFHSHPHAHPHPHPLQYQSQLILQQQQPQNHQQQAQPQQPQATPQQPQRAKSEEGRSGGPSC